MTSVQTTPLEKPFIQYKLEMGSLPIVIDHLNKNKLKALSTTTKVIKYDLDKFVPYSAFKVDGKLEDEHKYTYFIHSKTYYKVVEIYKIPRHINGELEAFTLDYKKANNYKKQSLYNMSLLLNTRFDIDVTDTETQLKANIKKYTDVEAQLDAKKTVLENKWTVEVKALYDKKSKLMHANKELYQARIKISKGYYETPKEKQLEDRAAFLESYRENLEKYNSNRDEIVQLNQDIELIEKKAGLYISETFFYYPTSILIITSIDKDGYNSMVTESTKVGGSLEDSEEGEISTKKKNVDYELEYLDLDNLEEDKSENMNSQYRHIKDKIKKITKKNNKFTNKELVTNLLNSATASILSN